MKKGDYYQADREWTYPCSRCSACKRPSVFDPCRFCRPKKLKLV